MCIYLNSLLPLRPNALGNLCLHHPHGRDSLLNLLIRVLKAWVQEWPEIESVVVGGVGFCMVGWSEGRHLMPVNTVATEEPLNFLVDLLRRECVAPGVEEFGPHAVGAEFLVFAESAVD